MKNCQPNVLPQDFAYITKGFCGWTFYGFTSFAPGEYNFGVSRYLDITRELYSDNVAGVCAIYATRHCITEESDDALGVELAQITAGKTAIMIFYGCDNISYMRRMTPEEFDVYEIPLFKLEKDDLYYNS